MKFSPTTTCAACSCSTSTVWVNVSGDSRMNSWVNGSTHMASTPELGDQLGLAVHRGEDRRVRARADHLGRVRVEGEQQAGTAHRARPGDRGPDQLLVAPVDAVVHADR